MCSRTTTPHRPRCSVPARELSKLHGETLDLFSSNQNAEKTLLEVVEGRTVCYQKQWYRLPDFSTAEWIGFDKYDRLSEELLKGTCEMMLAGNASSEALREQGIEILDPRFSVYSVPMAVAVPLGHVYL